MMPSTRKRPSHPKPQNLWISCLKEQKELCRWDQKYGLWDKEIILDHSHRTFLIIPFLIIIVLSGRIRWMRGKENKIWCVRGTSPTTGDFEHGEKETCARKCGQTHEESGTFSVQPLRTWDLSPMTSKNWIQPNPWIIRNWILSCGFQKGIGSCWHLDFSYLRSVSHRFVVICDTINRKLIKSNGDRKQPCFILNFMKKHEVCHHWVWYYLSFFVDGPFQTKGFFFFNQEWLSDFFQCFFFFLYLWKLWHGLSSVTCWSATWILLQILNQLCITELKTQSWFITLFVYYCIWFASLVWNIFQNVNYTY